MDALLKGLNEDPEADPLYFHIVTNINSSVWLPVARDRIYIMLIHRDLGIAVRNKMEKVFAEIIDRVASQAETRQPPPLSHFLLPTQHVAQQLAQMQAAFRIGDMLTCHGSGHFWELGPMP